MRIPRLVVAGSSSGVGKTSVSCGIILALRRAGYGVSPFKVGPDYIDPSHLTLAAANPTVNLDVWLMGRAGVVASFLEHSAADVSLVEGVMGYYDGSSGATNHSSTHHVASILGAPAVLVLDAAKASRSVAATALGFQKFHRNSKIRGVILNRLAGPRHERLCREAIEPLGIPILGCISRDESLSLPSRHLGLVPASESAAHSRNLLGAAKRISELIDADKLIRICKSAPEMPAPVRHRTRPSKTTLGVALDSSFNFYYHDNLERLRRAGTAVRFFSPVSDSKLPACDGLYIGGGFPEVQGQKLEKNSRMRNAVKKFAQDGGPVYAECGGLMYLASSIRRGSKKYKMAGVIEAQTVMTGKAKLSYTSAAVTRDCLVADARRKFHGHEFHYSELRSVPTDSKFAYDLSAGEGISRGRDGLMVHNTLASYGHLYFDSRNAEKFTNSCIAYSRR